MLKTMVMGIALAAAGLGAAFADRADDPGYPGRNSSLPAECIVAVAVAPGYLPRAGLTVENRRPHPIQVRLEGRGSGLDRVELGVVGAGEHRFFGHTLPAGRNVLTAGEGQSRPQVITVVNRGAETCARRYWLRVE